MTPANVIRSLLVFDDKHPLYNSYRIAKRIAIGIVGGTIVALGIVMMVTPGPGIPAILVGLGVLGIEFAWARSWLKQAKAKAEEMGRNFNTKSGNTKSGNTKDGRPKIGNGGENTPPPGVS